MLRIGVFIDTSNLYYCVRKKFVGRKLDYSRYLCIVKGYNPLGTITQQYAYGVRHTSEARNFISNLKSLGFITKFIKRQGNSRPNLNIDMTMDIVRCSDKLDVVVLGTSDRDVEPLVKWLVEKGITVETISTNVPKEMGILPNRIYEITEAILEDKK